MQQEVEEQTTKSEVALLKIKQFLEQTKNLNDNFYKYLSQKNQKKESIFLRRLFFNQNQKNQLQDDQINYQLSNSKILSNLNNGIVYTFIFDYIGSSQEFEQFSILRNELNYNEKKNTLNQIKDFVYEPENETTYKKIVQHMKWKSFLEVRITDDSSMAVCLNEAQLNEEWQLQFQDNLLKWLHLNQFSPGQAIGLGGNIAESLQMILAIWEQQKKKFPIWVFQDKLSQFQQKGDKSFFSDGSGNGALIRSAGLFQIYITLYKAFLSQNINDEYLKNEFDERITQIYMMDQHDQSSLTHFGFQSSICILFLAFIQIKLLIKQLSTKEEVIKKNLDVVIRELIDNFISTYLEKIFNQFLNTNKKLSEYDNNIKEILQNNTKKDSPFCWRNFLNVNTAFKDNNLENLVYNSTLVFYYQLFYKNDNGKFTWEEDYFIEYLSQKREYKREGINLDVSHPSQNEDSYKMKDDQYDKYLKRSDTGYFAAYAPDCMSLILNMIIKQKDKGNRDIFDYLYDICIQKGDCDSYGAVLATILAAYDLNYHLNFQSTHIDRRNNFMKHLDNQNLKTFGFILNLKKQVKLQEDQLQECFK